MTELVVQIRDIDTIFSYEKNAKKLNLKQVPVAVLDKLLKGIEFTKKIGGGGGS